MKLTKKEKNLMENMAKAAAKNPELEPVIEFLEWLSDMLRQRLKKFEKKQTELESRLANIWKKLLEVK